MISSFLNKSKPFVKVFIIILVLLIVRFLVIHIWFGYASRWKYNVENFEVYQEDFEKIANLCIDYCEQQNISKSEKSLFILASYENELLYKAQTISMADETRASLENIKGSFRDDDAQLDYIEVRDGTVYFVTHNGLYSVVYSPDEKPKYVDGVNVGVSRKIIDNWYHVAKK